jgi:hypothetical protein
MSRFFPRIVVAAAALLAWTGLPSAQRAADVLQPVFALAPHVVNAFEQPGAYVSTRQGHYLVLDRRAHTVHQVDPDGRAGRPMLHIGQEPGRVLRPLSLAISTNDVLAVMDAPGANQRIQYFTSDGRLTGGYYLPIAGGESLTVGNQVVSGSGAMAFSGDQIWINVPAWGSLMSALDGTGQFVRHIGQLRPTGHESTPTLHLALNAGVPAPDRDGSMFFVFQTGIPMLRRYSAAGDLIFERHIEGLELDPIIQRLPTLWVPRNDGSRPLPAPVVRTAAVDAEGQLWVVLQTGHVYVYNRMGEKQRVVTFGGALSELPSSLFFTSRNRVLVGPGGYEFDATPGPSPAAR